MKVLSLIAVSMLVSLHFIKSEAQHNTYTVPHPAIEVFRPRGLRVSIPDEDGIRLFAFHGVVNRHLNGLEAGDLNKETLKKLNGRWVFEDRKLRLNLGDALHYWLFVIKDNLGYRLDDQSYIVTEKIDAPPGFITGPKNPNRKTTPAPTTDEYPSPSYLEQAQCVCPQRPIEIVPPICNYPSGSPASATEQPLESTTPFVLPENMNVWRELLVNFSRENAHLRSQLVEIQEDKTYLANKLANIGDVNLHKLILSGRTENTDSAILQVETVLREKLGIDNFNIVQNAVIKESGKIIFELKTLEDKLHVLRKAKEKLAKSKFSITDADSVVIDLK